MNKLFTKIVGVALGLTMALGVGVAVASNSEAVPVHAATETTTYTFSSKAWAATPANWTSGKDGNQMQSGRGVQITTGASGANATSPVNFTNVSKVVVTYSTNASDGAGSISIQVGSNTAKSINVTKTGGTTNRTLEYTYAPYQTGNVKLTATCTTNSIYVKSVDITTTQESQNPEIEFSETAISGEEGTPFSFTWTESNLTSDITWSPASASTDIINYTVNTSTKTVSGTLNKAGSVTLTGTSGTASDSVVFTVTEHENNRKYTVTSTSAVSESGDTMTGTSSTFVNTYTTKDQITSSKTMTLKITGMTKTVNINKLVFSMHSNKSAGAGYVTVAIDGGNPDYIEGTSSGTPFTNFGDDTTSYGTTYRDITWDDLDFSAKSSIEIVIKCTTNSLYCQWFDIFFSEEENTDVVTALSVTPNSWSGYDSGTIDVSDYTVTVTKGEVAGTSADYDFQGIGSGAGDNFVAREADFTSGHPTTSDTRLQWKAKYPTEVGGSTYLYAYVSLSVTADTISSITVSGSMPTNYSLGGSWSTEGLVVTATYASGVHDTLSSDLTWNFYSDSELTTEVTTPDNLGVGDNQTIYVKATYTGVTPSKVSAGYAQVVNVTKEPGVVNFGTATGAIQMSSGSGSGTDTLGNSVSATCNSGAFQENHASETQVGSKNNPLTNWTITISFSELVGVESFEIKFQGSGGSSNQEYTAVAHHNDLGNQEIMNGGVDGSTLVVDSTDNTYSALNANSLVVTFTGSSYGVKLYYISYQLGTPVKEFGTLDHIAISQESTHNTLFKVGDTFSSAGMIIIATDTTGFSQNYTSGFTTTYDNHPFVKGDVDEDIENTVSLTIKGVTKTTSYTFDVINPPTYSLVESQSELYEGMKVIIYGSDNKALGTENSGYFNEGAVTFDGDIIDDGAAATEFTVRIYGMMGFALQHGSKYLQYHGTGNNAYLDSTLNEKAVWTLGENGLTNVENSTRVLRHNSSASRFACYSTETGSTVSLYVSSATPKTDLMGAETFAQKYLHMRDYDSGLHEGVSGDGYCSDSTNHYYSTAKAFYNSASFSAEEKVEFAKLTDAVKRLQAWAIANGESFDPTLKTFSSARISPLANIVGENGSTAAIIVVVSSVSLTAIGGYFFFRKRKEQ